MFDFADLVNGCFETLAGLFSSLNCWRLYKDKVVKGFSVIAVTFFTFWGFWNLYYYPSLEQKLSFYGGLTIVTVNTIWICQIIYYKYKRATL